MACGELAPRNANEIALCNGLDQAVIAPLALPEGEPPAAGWPGVVLLHGSGGLFGDEDKGCSEALQDRHRIWTETLTSRGYAVMAPASFFSRGFCDWHKSSKVPRQLDEHERLVVRTFDAAAAADWMCEDPRVDCSKIAVLGFSNGGSTTLVVMHADLAEAEDPRLHELASPTPRFVGGVAYYPGCGLHGEFSGDVSGSDLTGFYYPQAPLWVPHAEEDRLLERCEEIRDPQVDMVASDRGVSQDMFELEVYAGADHGFDGWDSGDPQADLDAFTDAQAQTFAHFEAWFQ